MIQPRAKIVLCIQDTLKANATQILAILDRSKILTGLANYVNSIQGQIHKEVFAFQTPVQMEELYKMMVHVVSKLTSAVLVCAPAKKVKLAMSAANVT